MKVIRMRLTDDTMVPPNIRFFEGNIEITFDGGLTWVISPENDPRYGVQFLAPPLDSIDAKCEAAYRMTQIIRAQVDAALDAANAVGLATAIISIITILIPINPIVALVTALATLLLAIGAVVLDAAFDEDRYDAIQCIFYNNISENGQVTAEQLEAILSAFETEFAGSVASDVCVSVVFVMGQNGLSNAGSLTSGDGDCSGCDDIWCYSWDFTLDDYVWGAFVSGASAFAQWQLGVGWIPSTSTYIIVQSALFTGHVTNVKLFYTTERDRVRVNAPGTPGDNNGSEWTTGMLDDPTYELIGGLYVYGYELDNDITGFQMFSDPVGGSGALVRIELNGTGSNPFGSDNC